jgi:RNA polymerase sigma-70 factor (ECF subfamily)
LWRLGKTHILRVKITVFNISIVSKLLSSHSKNIEMSDSEIVREYLRTQNSLYFSQLYRKYANKVYGKCLSILKNDDEARDAVQDIFVKIMLNMGGFGEKSQFSTWIYSITYNYCIDTIRKRKKEKTLFSDELENTKDVADEEVPDEYLLEMDVKQLKTVLEMLPAGDRAVLLMKYQDDMSIKDIADGLNKTESAIKMKIKRAKHKAQEIFNDMYKRDI